MAQAIVTSRSLRNVDTGIDVSIPEYREVTNRLGLTKEEEFDIIVITKLPYFKRDCHQLQDVVQFMVSRRFSEFENLRKVMDDKFPATVFPELPKKSFVLSEDGASGKRRLACEKFLQFIAKSIKICCSHPFLEFLGVKMTKIKEIEDGSTPIREDTASLFKKVKPKSTTSDLFGEGNDSDEDLFGDLDSERPPETEDLFADESKDKDGNLRQDGKPSTDHTVRLFVEEDTDAPVYMPPGAMGDNDDGVPGATEDMSDLLNIDDDLDALLLKAKPKPSQKPPSTKVKADTTSQIVATKSDVTQADIDLDNDDIMKYIADNEQAPSESLF